MNLNAEKLHLLEQANDIREKLEGVLPLEHHHLAVEVTNIEIRFSRIIRQLERPKK